MDTCQRCGEPRTRHGHCRDEGDAEKAARLGQRIEGTVRATSLVGPDRFVELGPGSYIVLDRRPDGAHDVVTLQDASGAGWVLVAGYGGRLTPLGAALKASEP